MSGQLSSNICSVAGCKNRKKPLFRFPNPRLDAERFQQWVQAANNPRFLGLSELQIKNRGFMCYRHFSADDFIQGSNKLVPTAIPRIHISSQIGTGVVEPQPSTSTFQYTLPIMSTPEKQIIEMEYSTPPKEQLPFWVGTPRKRVTPLKYQPKHLEPQPSTSGSFSTIPHILITPEKQQVTTHISEMEEHSYTKPLLVERATSPGCIYEIEEDSYTKALERDTSPGCISEMREHSYAKPLFLENGTSPACISELEEHAYAKPLFVDKATSPEYPSELEVSHTDDDHRSFLEQLERVETTTVAATPHKKVPVVRLKKTPARKVSLKQRLGLKSTKNFTPQEHRLYGEAQRLQTRVTRLERTQRSVKTAYQIARKIKFREMVENMTPVQQRFFESQVRNLRRKLKGRSFTFDDKADAIAIWKSSPKTYKLLSKMFVMPSVSTLKTTLNKVLIQPGISKPIFRVLAKQIGQMELVDRICILIFDEIAIQPHLDYFHHQDKIIGFEDDGWTRTRQIADHASVFMLRGIYKRWKQPVALAFCKSSMKPESIVRFYKEIIQEAVAAGLYVIASVCDQGATNVKAINTLLAETKRLAILEDEEVKDNIINLNGQQIIPLFDPPHLLKSIRNNLLTKDLRFTHDGHTGVAKWSYVVDAFHLDKVRLFRFMKKLTEEHVIPCRIRKMKVSLCAQVLSQTVATCLYFFADSTYGGSPLPPDALATARLFGLLDNIFDSVNGGYGKTSGKCLRERVTRKSSHQPWWKLGKQLFSEMEFIKSKPGDRAKPPVLDGWCRTLDGFISIRNILLRHLGFESFPARAFNQDPLENFFGQIRQFGVRYTNPSCKTFVPYYKALLVRNFSSYHSSGANCERDFESLQVTIKDFLSQQDTERHGIVDQWMPPSVDDEDEPSLDTNLLSYIGGFLVHNVSPQKYNCDICLRNLRHSGELDDLHHRLTALREYDDEKKRLEYVNINIVKVLLKLYNNIKILLPSAIYHHHISERIISHLRLTIDFDFEECEHSETIKSQLFHLFLKVYIFEYMKRLNKIASGQLKPSSETQDQLELEMYRLCRRQFKK